MTDLDTFAEMLTRAGQKFEVTDHGGSGLISVTFTLSGGLSGGGEGDLVDAWFRHDGSLYDFSGCD